MRCIADEPDWVRIRAKRTGDTYITTQGKTNSFKHGLNLAAIGQVVHAYIVAYLLKSWPVLGTYGAVRS